MWLISTYYSLAFEFCFMQRVKQKLRQKIWKLNLNILYTNLKDSLAFKEGKHGGGDLVTQIFCSMPIPSDHWPKKAIDQWSDSEWMHFLE